MSYNSCVMQENRAMTTEGHTTCGSNKSALQKMPPCLSAGLAGSQAEVA